MLAILVDEGLQEELGDEDVLMPREVYAKDIPVHRLDSDPDPRLERPDLDVCLVHEECLDPLHAEDLARLVPLDPLPDGRVGPLDKWV